MSVELDQAYEELTILHRLSATLRVERPVEEVLHDACAGLVAGAGLAFAAVRLAGGAGLMPTLAVAEPEAAADGAGSARLRALVDAAAAELLATGYVAVPGSILEPVDALARPRLAELTPAAIVVPLRIGDEAVGVLLAAVPAGAELLSSVEAKLAESVAGPLSIFLENRRLFERARELATAVLVSLVRAIDAKDPATRGHSERVSALARAVGEELKLPPAEVDRLRLAGLVHDLGKLGVPESILLKKGKLTDEEFAAIRRHPQAGVDILRGIEPLADLLPAVLHHHERYDGRGYPAGIGGEAIPLHARILGVVDAFDAMHSRRSYHEGAAVAACLGEIERNAGSQFDPRIVAAFVATQQRSAVGQRRLAA